MHIDTLDDFLERVSTAAGDRAVAVAQIDLDGFAIVNEEFGRKGGDRVLASWERTLSGSVPKGSVVGRTGGDEYGVALPGASAESALIVLDEVRAHFASHAVAGVDAALNASVGIAARPPHADGIVDLWRAAGEALMRAKREGAGRVAIYVEEKMTLKSNYYSRAALDRLGKLSSATGRTEASLLREALDELLQRYREIT